MKILYVNDFDVRGGAETFVHELASYMEKKGHEVYFAFANTKGGDRIRKIDWSKGTLGESTIYTNVNDPIVYQQMKDTISSVKPDITHFNNLTLLTLAPVIAAKELAIPHVISMLDYWNICPRRSLFNYRSEICASNNWSDCFRCVGAIHPSKLVRFIAKELPFLGSEMLEANMMQCYETLRDETIICPSSFVKNALVRFGYKPENCPVIALGVDVDLFKPNFDSSQTFLWVGRINPTKGLEYFVKAADIVKAKYPSTQFSVLGTASPDAMYQYRKIPSSNAVRFLGRISPMCDQYSNSLALVISSVCPEMFPFVAIEAMASGKPVIAFANGALREIVDNGKTGLLVESKDSVALADAMIALIEDEGLAIKMGREARKSVESNHRIERMCADYERMYSERIGVLC